MTMTVQTIADKLVGTSRGLTDEEQEFLSVNGHATAFDKICFECETCAYWFPIAFLANEEDQPDQLECVDCDVFEDGL